MNELAWLVGVPLTGALLILFLRRWPRICSAVAGVMLITSAVASLKGDLAPSFEILGQTMALTRAASQNLSYAYLLIGVASIVSCRSKQDGLLYGLVLNSAALTTLALAAHSNEIMAFLGAAGLLSLALAAPLTQARPWLQSMRVMSVLALLPLVLLMPLWILETQNVPPIDEAALQTASVIAVVAAGLLLGLFPLHLWRSSLQTLGHPAVVLSMATLASLLGLQYVVRLLHVSIWPRFGELARPLLLYSGALTAFVGGVMSVVHAQRREILGHAALAYWGGTIVQVGRVLPNASATATIDLWLGGITLLAATSALWCLQQETDPEPDLALRPAKDIGWLASLAFAVSIYALSGLPLSAAFPVRLPGTLRIAIENTIIGLALLVGAVGVGWGALKMLPSEAPVSFVSHKQGLLGLVPCVLAVLLTLLLVVVFLFPVVLRAIPTAWLPDLLSLY